MPEHVASKANLNDTASSLAVRLTSRQAIVGIIGLGYVGLPLCMAIAGVFRVVGFDLDPAKAQKLHAGKSYIKHIGDDQVARLVKSELFAATTDFARLSTVDVILICVPTPLTAHQEPDLSFVVETTKTIAKHLRAGQMVILESTTYPGTTRDLMQPILEAGGLKAGRDFFLAFSPEREDPGNPTFSTSKIPKVVGADDANSRDLAVKLYSSFVVDTVQVSSAATAEAVKITENVFRAVNIALVNELKLIYGAMGVDVWEVIDAAKTKPFGYMPFYPGPGLGGHCIPIDPFYLTWKAKEYGITTRFIELAGEINTTMPKHVVNELAMAIDREHHKGMHGARILVLGIAYKKNVDDPRESPSLRLIELIEARGATTEFHDPYIPTIPNMREHASLGGRKGIDLKAADLAAFDAVLIATDHDSVDYSDVVARSRLVIDTRNVCQRVGVTSEKIVKA